MAEQVMGVFGIAVAIEPGIEDRHPASRPAQLHGSGQTGKTASDNENILHGRSFRMMRRWDGHYVTTYVTLDTGVNLPVSVRGQLV